MSNIVFLTTTKNAIQNFLEYSEFSDEIKEVRTIIDARLLTDIINTAKLQVDILAIDCDNLPEPLSVIKSRLINLPKIKHVVGLISEADVTTVLSLVRYNFSGIISKSANYDDFCSALITIRVGIFYVSQCLNQKIYATMLHNDSPMARLEEFNLTKKQFKLAMLLIDGCSYAVISKEMNIKLESVKQSVNRLYKRIGISSRSELTALYYRSKLDSNI